MPSLRPLVVLCCVAIVLATAQQGNLTVLDPPYNTSVQDLLAPSLAVNIGPTGGHAYLGTAVSSPTVCAAANTRALIAPATVTVVDNLFYRIGGNDKAHLDTTHKCYLDPTQDPPQCVATLKSTAVDCGGNPADAVGPLLNLTSSTSSSSRDAAVNSAALLAAYLETGAAQRLKLERSLRRTREVVVALNRVHDLVLNASNSITNTREMEMLRRRATQYVLQVVNAAYDRVMEKYYVFGAWTNASLGIASQNLSHFTGPETRACGVYDYIRRLLWGNEASSTVFAALVQATLGIADSIHAKTYTPAIRGVQCAQVLTGLAMMTLEDDVVRQLAAMITGGTLNGTSVWEVKDFALLLPNRTAVLRQRQLWSLAYVFAAVSDPAVVDDLVGGAAVAECMRRTALVVPDGATSTVPPSLSWCLDNTSLSAMAQSSVAQRSLAVHESATAANGQCLWGLSVWDGQCGGAAFDPARCESCPAGSVGDSEGHCVCGNATGTYPTLTSGCVSKGAAHDVAGVRVLQENGNITLSGNASVTLLSVQLPQTASLADPSAFLRVNVTCVDGGRGGGTRLLATPGGNRTAACASVVAYERHAERTGARNTFNGTQYFETYADNLTLAVLGSAAFFGETCRVEVVVRSALRQASRTVVVGTWTFTPAAEAFTLRSHGCTGSIATKVAAAPSDVPLCHLSSAAAAYAGGASERVAAVQVGVCRTTDGNLAVYVQPAAYFAFGTSTQLAVGQRIHSTAGASRDGSFIATMQSLANITAFELSVRGANSSSAALWSGVWQLNGTPLVVNAWASGWVVPMESSVLRDMRSLRLRVLDMTNTSAFAAAEAIVECRYGNDTDSNNNSSGSGDNHNGSGTRNSSRARYDFWYVILIIIASVLDAAVLAAFVLLVYMHHSSYDKWPKRAQ